MRQLFCLLVVGAALATARVEATEVVRWVDEDGVTHFGQPQFAPAEHTPVEIAPANGMEPARYTGHDSADGPSVITLDRTHFENKRGFRGYRNRPTGSSSRHH